MNIFHRIIQPDSVLCDVHVRSKKHCLELLSGLLVRPKSEVAEDEIFTNLIERERLGCTSLGDGVAFPHCRVSGAQGSTGALIALAEPVEFEAPDGVPVGLVFGLLVPAEPDSSHRADITEIARLLADERLRSRLREARSREELYEVLTGYSHGPARRSAGAGR